MTRTFTHTLLLFCGVLCYSGCIAQQRYGNEWIDYRQTYLRIPVVETGIYKITATELARAGIPADSIRTAGIQLFAHGTEVPIEVVGDSSGRLASEGYLLFAGKKNDGYADTALYTKPDAMPHTYYNLYSDTTAYFLTWQTDQGGLRTTFPAPGTVTHSAALHWEETMQLFTSHYLPGRFFPPESNYETGSLLTAYDEGEGWTGPEIAEHKSFEIVFKTNRLFQETPSDIDCEILLAGWSPGVHSFALWLGGAQNLKRRLFDLNVVGRETKAIRFKIPIADFDEAGQLVLTLLPVGTGGHVSLSYARMRYPQAGPRVAPGHLPTPPSRIVRFSSIHPETEYLIITHPLMRTPVNGHDAVADYAQYRASDAGGGYHTSIVHSYELYDQFNAGQPGPHGIRNAIRWLHDQGKLKFVLLAGRSIDPQKARKMKDSWQTDMVPNAGWPGSDIALATQKGNFNPLVPIGRINALNARQMLDYLLKVKAMEAEPATAAWRKRILHLSGGRSKDELNVFRDYMQFFEKKLDNTPLAGKVTTISKLTDNAVEPVRIDKQINEGVGLVTLFGHSSIDVTDIDIGRATDPARNYRNHPHYPAMIVNGCAAGSIFYSTQTLSSDWIFAPESGAVLFLAHTFNGPSTALRRYTELFYEVLADSPFTSKPFGMIQREAIRRNLNRNPGILDSITIQQMTLHGDPAIRIFPSMLPDTVADNPSVDLPPLMQLLVDGRLLVNDDIISKNPVLTIRIFDENLPVINDDTTLVSIWLKKHCTGCTDLRIPLQTAIGRNVEGKFYEIILQPALTSGKYLLTMQCRDKTGHSAAPYQIDFEVAEYDGPITATVSPNPSGQWFRFTIQNKRLLPNDLELTIRNVLGTTVFRKVLHCFVGRNEHFWHPAMHSPGIPAGLYHYTISAAEASRHPAFPFESMRGHLLYAP
ncbi:Peptidase family C25 [Dyadobacter soli]|uniref:Peptidase family C25 n=1 Tax=Dyadobacter soli TaxID=659014 RepID=A0A1G7IPR0_9BACT|nr:C25 family cysteine peptidase [Dyadobacter soli]SDF14661.1 Peptidase family C25 [Dyadobacter soli]